MTAKACCPRWMLFSGSGRTPRLADNADAKLETFTEILEGTSETGWLGYNRFFESNLRMTRMD